MKGKYKATLTFLLSLVLVPLMLVMTLGPWVPTLVGIWLPVGTRIALDEGPRLIRHGLRTPELRHLVEDCPLTHIIQVDLSHLSRRVLNAGTIELDSACLAKLLQAEPSPVAPRTLAEWQLAPPNTWINIDKFIFSLWQK